MDTIMNFAGSRGLIGCERPIVGYYIKLLHDGRANNHVTYVDMIDTSDNSKVEEEAFEEVHTDDSYKAYGFLAIKVLPNGCMPETIEDAMDPANTNLSQGKMFLVNENGEFGADDIIWIDMNNEVGIDVDDNQSILEISLNELRRELAEDDGTVFQARDE